MAYDFFLGSSYNRVGTLQLNGPVAGGNAGLNKNQPDYSNWSIRAAFYDQSGTKLISNLVVTNLSNPALPQTNGLVQLANPAPTDTWPTGKVQLLIAATTDAGAILPTRPVWYRFLANPLLQGGGQ